jgi:hypothetical protein
MNPVVTSMGDHAENSGSFRIFMFCCNFCFSPHVFVASDQLHTASLQISWIRVQANALFLSCTGLVLTSHSKMIFMDSEATLCPRLFKTIFGACSPMDLGITLSLALRRITSGQVGLKLCPRCYLYQGHGTVIRL